MPAPLISICITSYNHRNFIKGTIESARQQTFKDWEMILIDDGSTDGTLDALAGLQDERISIHAFAANQTRCVALNQTLARAKGRYIAILNSDDLWHPLKLEKQLEVLETHRELGVAFTWVEMIDECDTSLGVAQHFRQPNQASQRWLNHFLSDGVVPFCHPSALIRRAVLDQVGFYDERLTQLLDFDLWIRLCEHSEAWVVPEVLTYERILSDRSNASGDRPDVWARTHWERTLVYFKALQRNHPRLRSALRELDPTRATQCGIHEQDSQASNHDPLTTLLLASNAGQLSESREINQSFKIATALHLFQSLPECQATNSDPGETRNDIKSYHQWIKNLDPLYYFERIQLEGTKRQLDRVINSTSWKLTAPFRKQFWQQRRQHNQ